MYESKNSKRGWIILILFKIVQSFVLLILAYGFHTSNPTVHQLTVRPLITKSRAWHMSAYSDKIIPFQLLGDGTRLFYQNRFSISRNIWMKHSETNTDYLSFSSDTQQSNTSERERNRHLTDLYTQMWIEIGQSEKRWMIGMVWENQSTPNDPVSWPIRLLEESEGENEL